MYGPSLPSTSRLRSRMLPNVPRIITSWWPRRAPYELKSSGATPCSWSQAGRGPGGDRAGRADVVGRDRVAEHRQDAGALDVASGARVAPRPSKNGGLATYVERVPGVAVARSGIGSARHRSSPSNTLA